MSILSQEEVKHVAKLANLVLKEENIDKYSKDLSSIVELISKLRSLATDSVIPTSQVTGQTNVFRDDQIDSERGLTQKEALSNAKNVHRGYFVVPKILDQ